MINSSASKGAIVAAYMAAKRRRFALKFLPAAIYGTYYRIKDANGETRVFLDYDDARAIAAWSRDMLSGGYGSSLAELLEDGDSPMVENRPETFNVSEDVVECRGSYLLEGLMRKLV